MASHHRRRWSLGGVSISGDEASEHRVRRAELDEDLVKPPQRVAVVASGLAVGSQPASARDLRVAGGRSDRRRELNAYSQMTLGNTRRAVSFPEVATDEMRRPGSDRWS